MNKQLKRHLNFINVVLSVWLLFAAGCGGGSSTSSGSGDTVTAPTATAETLTVTMGKTASGSLSGKGSSPLTYTIGTVPLDGTASLTNPATGAFTYTSYPNFTGTDTLQFTVSNSAGTSQAATETINVTSGALGAPQAVANIGVSLDWLCYWCAVQPYVDIVHQAAQFGDPTTGVSLAEEGKLDQNGWPSADFRWMVICCIHADGSATDPGPASPLAGAYQLSFSGKAVIYPLTFSVENQQYNPTTNTTTATLDLGTNYQGANAMLTFNNTQRTASSATGTGVTNIQIIRPQFAPNGMKWWDSPTQEFTKPFLDSLKSFSTVRSMSFTSAINSPEVNWSDRTPDSWPVASHLMEAAPSSLPYLVPPAASCTAYCDWYSTGASWGSVIDIANASHTDMWINIPVMASDDYVKSLATLIKSKLDPGLHVYVEWSDEIWNYANPWWTETNYNADQTTALLASDPTSAADYSANCVSWANSECHVAERVMQFSQDFASVYGQAAINTTIRPLLCTQVVQPVLSMEALRFIANTYGPPSNYFYGTCGAPYWGVSGTLPTATTAAGAVAALDQAIPNNDTYLQADTATALYYGLHNLTYEGGPNNTSFAVAADTSGQAAKVLETSVQMAPGMKADVTQGLTRAFQDGTDMYMFYENESATYWGATTDPLDLDAPKFAGLSAAAGQSVTRNAGTAIPGNIAAVPPAFALLAGAPVHTYQMHNCSDGNGSTVPPNCGFSSSIAVGDGYGYLVDVPQAGTYSVSLTLLDSITTGASSLELDVDRKSVGTFSISAAPNGTAPVVGSLSVTLTAGLHVIDLLNASDISNCAVTSINVASQ